MPDVLEDRGLDLLETTIGGHRLILDAEQVEALLRGEAAHDAEQRDVGPLRQAELALQRGLVGGLRLQPAARVDRREVRVGRRVPDRLVDPVADPDEPFALGPQLVAQRATRLARIQWSRALTL